MKVIQCFQNNIYESQRNGATGQQLGTCGLVWLWPTWSQGTILVRPRLLETNQGLDIPEGNLAQNPVLTLGSLVLNSYRPGRLQRSGPVRLGAAIWTPSFNRAYSLIVMYFATHVFIKLIWCLVTSKIDFQKPRLVFIDIHRCAWVAPMKRWAGLRRCSLLHASNLLRDPMNHPGR